MQQGLQGLQFSQGIKVSLEKNFTIFVKIVKKGGIVTTLTMAYLPWASAIALAGRPSQKVNGFGSGRQPFLEMLGGAVVAVTQQTPNKEQTTWLPILDGANNPIEIDRITSRDVIDTINRCRAKACAMNNGVGMAIYAGYFDPANNTVEVLKYLQDLGVKPDSDLLSVQPLTQIKPGKAQSVYVDWADAVTAAKITDPEFHWEVDSYPNGQTQALPVLVIGDYYMVSVTVTYKGIQHTELLPIMGFAEVSTSGGVKMLDHQPLVKPTVHDWNRSVMRCLTKAIAVVSGYGLSIYARADIESLVNVKMVGKKPPVPATPVAPEVAPEAPDVPLAPPSAPASVHSNMQAEIVGLLAEKGRTFAQLSAFLKTNATSVEGLNPEQLLRAKKALSNVKKAA